jgi:hypothetical protein
MGRMGGATTFNAELAELAEWEMCSACSAGSASYVVSDRMDGMNS